MVKSWAVSNQKQLASYFFQYFQLSFTEPNSTGNWVAERISVAFVYRIYYQNISIYHCVNTPYLLKSGSTKSNAIRIFLTLSTVMVMGGVSHLPCESSYLSAPHNIRTYFHKPILSKKCKNINQVNILLFGSNVRILWG